MYTVFQYIPSAMVISLSDSIYLRTNVIDQIVFSRNKLDLSRDTYLNKIPFSSIDTIEDKTLYNGSIALSTVRSILNLIFRIRSSTASLYSKEMPRFTCIFHCSITKLENWLLLAYSSVAWYRVIDVLIIKRFTIVTFILVRL